MKNLLLVVLLTFSLSASADLAGLFQRLTGTEGVQKNIVILVDQSPSIKIRDRGIYKQSFNSILNSIQLNDRVMLGSIADLSRSEYILEKNIKFNRTGVRLDDEESMNNNKEALSVSFNKLNKSINTKSTKIIDAVMAVSEALKPSSNKRNILVIFSDMVEVSLYINLDKRVNKNSFLKLNHIDGSLDGVEVFVAGASGSDYLKVKEFWNLYFKKAGSHIKNYGRLELTQL